MIQEQRAQNYEMRDSYTSWPQLLKTTLTTYSKKISTISLALHRITGLFCTGIVKTSNKSPLWYPGIWYRCVLVSPRWKGRVGQQICVTFFPCSGMRTNNVFLFILYLKLPCIIYNILPKLEHLN